MNDVPVAPALENTTPVSLHAERSPRFYSVCCRVLHVARRRAVRLGLLGADAEDCAFGFLAHLFATQRAFLHRMAHGLNNDAWLMRAADNWAKNVYRQCARRLQREISWPQAPEALDKARTWEPEGAEPDPQQTALREELRLRILAVAQQLTPPQRDLFARYYLLEQDAAQIAAASGRTPNAVGQGLWALRRKLRVLLEQQGLNEAEAGDYLCLLARKASQ